LHLSAIVDKKITRKSMKNKKLNPIQFALPLIAITASLLISSPATAITNSIQFGDLEQGSVTVWSHTDHSARMMIRYALNPQFTNAKTIRGPYALENNDYTAKQQLTRLPQGVDVYVKVWFEDLTNARTKTKPVLGHFHTIGANDNIRFVWGGDTAGQGWGINEAFGGMKIYEAMRQAKPQFFIHSGDTIYADNVIPATLTAENGQIWTNVVTPEVSKVAETLAEFRGRYKYNLLDANVRAFNAEVPQIWQWDDHEVVNNWSNSKDLTNDARYTVKDVPLLAARAFTAFGEYSAQRPTNATTPGRIYRKISYGPLLDVFVLDMRSYRGANSGNLQTTESAATAFLGNKQVAWLQAGLKNSTATWKVIAADQPLSVNIANDFPANPPQSWEAVANGNNGPALGRELEIARLLSNIKQVNVKNIIWLTADVHYAAAYNYDPAQAQFKDFNGFWEFIAGPLNAGTYGGYTLDATFGPQLVFKKEPVAGSYGFSGLSPYGGMQFFGEVNIDKVSKAMTVDLKDINGVSVFRQLLNAQ
jgi:alkaline phosphatase D